MEGLSLHSFNRPVVQVKDKLFQIFLNEQEITHKVKELALLIEADYANTTPLLLPVLNGSFIFASDLMRALKIPCALDFVKYKSYHGMESSGSVSKSLPPSDELKGKDILIIEDIVDTGLTMKAMLEDLQQQGVRSVNICTLLFKPGKFKESYQVKYKGFEIPDDFVVGYGLDYDGQGRNLPAIYKVLE